MKLGISVLLASASVVLVGCSSSEKKVDANNSAPVSPATHSMTKEDISTKYSLLELNSAANLLKVVFDEGAKKPSADVGSDIIGCPLTSRQAGAMTMPIKYLIDQQVRQETESYTTDPKSYGTEKGFEVCAAQCACGVLSDVIEGANESSMPAGSAKAHSRNKQRLSVKATHQTSRDSLACARKQSWFCASDLKAYLDKEAH